MPGKQIDSLITELAALVKQLYVLLFRCLRFIASRVGLLRALEARKGSRILLWLRSLFAIYDLEDMVHLGVAWWTFQSVDLVERFLESVLQARVFEYGGGASTVWLARRAGSVYFVEHDATYKKSIDNYTASFANVTGFLEVPVLEKSPGSFTSHKPNFHGLSFKNYVKRIDEVDGLFDLIVIDGRCREQCLENALPHLSETGCLVFDNSNRQRYRSAIKQLGYPTIETYGLTPCLPYPNQTTLIFKSAAIRDKFK